ncbi:uncharacterized protein PV09_02627 [Verruconis gallopava]|uniref:Uncharacterized protein n=1 Tax=Verruconis gallopava TaxID=253628 RepID=A0A0D2AJ93_9PEZI|nr:uncharacterized protein PV09_02627 [Verruconis gallopava]KIW06968.1 hypothetical protein PV09_02627 [Verruconis gallopava]
MFAVIFLLIHACYCGIVAPENTSDSPQKLLGRVLNQWDANEHWSQSSLVLARRNYVYSLHNYTIEQSETKSRVRWTMREGKEILPWGKRGFTANHQTHKWDASNTFVDNRGKIWIQLCYVTAEDAKQLGPYIAQCVNRWHAALGCNSGVGFYIKQNYCTDPRRDVHVMVDQNAYRGKATVGTRLYPNSGYPLHWIKLPLPARVVGQATHIGISIAKVLTRLALGSFSILEKNCRFGLYHEQSRQDWRAAGLDIEFTAIPGYQAAVNYVNNNILVWPQGSLKQGQRITVNDILTYGELNRDPRFALCRIWAGKTHVPSWVRADGTNSLGNVRQGVPYGAFDWDSIMLYPTRPEWIFWRLVNGVRQEIPGPRPDWPSQEDIAAVKFMYPDLPPPNP